MTRGKGKNEEDEWIDQVQSEVQRGRVPTYIGGASPINDRDVYVRKWEVISNTYSERPMPIRVYFDNIRDSEIGAGDFTSVGVDYVGPNGVRRVLAGQKEDLSQSAIFRTQRA